MQERRLDDAAGARDFDVRVNRPENRQRPGRLRTRRSWMSRSQIPSVMYVSGAGYIQLRGNQKCVGSRSSRRGRSTVLECLARQFVVVCPPKSTHQSSGCGAIRDSAPCRLRAGTTRARSARARTLVVVCGCARFVDGDDDLVDQGTPLFERRLELVRARPRSSRKTRAVGCRRNVVGGRRSCVARTLGADYIGAAAYPAAGESGVDLTS